MNKIERKEVIYGSQNDFSQAKSKSYILNCR